METKDCRVFPLLSFIQRLSYLRLLCNCANIKMGKGLIIYLQNAFKMTDNRGAWQKHLERD